MIERIQAIADRNIRRFGLLASAEEGADLPGEATDAADLPSGQPGDRRPHRAGVEPDAAARRDRTAGAAVMEKPFAITLDVGSSLANKTGSWRTERAVYVDRLPPCNHACPAGENIQDWLYEAEEGGEGYERAWRKIMEDNPFPAIMGRVCYHPCETACNRGAARRVGRDQLGGAASSATRRSSAGWRVERARRALRQARAGRRRRARPGSRPPTT